MTDLTSNLAQAAYRAYGDTTGGLNYQGLPMPTWGNLGPAIQAAWVAAAGRVETILVNPGTVAAEQSRANYASAWAELTGYVQQAADDGESIAPTDLLPYMRELRRGALAPVREWMNSITPIDPGAEEAAR